ncbi:hypothetical protein ACH40F_08145 [Streptomyces sp. NPDC020794]|uniref:hypothetical protein n=1 Tax=unclassified Streptomyces TaxID=2593676 RepID=UPI0036EF6E0E
MATLDPALTNAGPDLIRARRDLLYARRHRLNEEITAVEELLLRRSIEKRDGLWPPTGDPAAP